MLENLRFWRVEISDFGAGPTRDAGAEHWKSFVLGQVI